MGSDILDAALSYAARGWPVLPMHSINEDGNCSCGAFMDYQENGLTKHAMGKHPYTEHGHKDVSKEASQIHLWWQQWPEANVAIRTGQVSGLVVLDVDNKSGGRTSLLSLERRYGELPPTPRVRSGGGGLHLFFKYPGFEVRGRVGMRPGIDVMADGGKIVAPPSRHKSGNRYEWDPMFNLENTPISALPRWLLTMIKTKNPPKKKLKLAGIWG